MALFSKEDQQRIEARIEAVESRSAGEVVVAEVQRCDNYSGRRFVNAGLLSLVLAAGVHELWPLVPTDWVLLTQVPLVALLYFLTGLGPVLRALVPRAERVQEVEQRAARMFTERAVFDTRDHSGVLIMLSELEHQVVVLGDRGILARLQVSGFEQYVKTIVAAVRSGRAAEGVCQVLDALGEVLAADFPRREDDVDELPNRVVQEP